MENLSKEERENVLLYATYTILYVNDKASAEIRNLAPHIKDKDKETKKKFNALMKRVRAYRLKIFEIEGDQSEFMSYYSDVMDGLVDKFLNGFRRSISWVLRCNGIPSYDYLSRIETARVMSDVAISTIDELILQLGKSGIPKKGLPTYRITEIHEIMNDLARWVVLVEHVEKEIDLNKKKSVMGYLEKLKRSMFSADNFDEAYATALHKENERKANDR